MLTESATCPELSPLLARRALDAAPDAVIIVDRNGMIRYANARTGAMFGYAPGGIIGKPVECLMPDRFHEKHAGHRRRYLLEPRVRPMGASIQLFGRRSDGGEFPVDISLSPMDVDDDLLTICAIRDVTHHLLNEQTRLKSQEELEARVAERTQELEAAKDEANRANAVKSRFLAAASHDLRQPLQTIWTLQGTLARAFKDTEHAPHIALLEEAVRSMDQMLSALIDINRLEHGAIHPVIRDFPLTEILPRLRSEFAYAAASKVLALDIEDSTLVARSDPMLLPVILRNLLGNAIKYTQRGSVCLRTRTADDLIFIDVIDSGPGIPHEHLRRLFDAFYQIDNPKKDQRQGVGLGLSIVQTVCKLLGHEVTVESALGQGSTFTVRLPVGAPVEETASNPSESPKLAAPRLAGKVTILHIEDDPGVARSMALLLRLEGYDVVGATTRDEALDQISTHGVRPDLILCDYNLPMGYTGDEIVSELSICLGFKPPTVILTGDIADKHVKRARLVADRILPKPVDVDLLLDSINALLKQRSTGEEMSENFDGIPAEVPLASRCDPLFAELLTQPHLSMLEDHPHSVFGVWSDLTLAYFNPGWFAFAMRNGGEEILSGNWGIGRSSLDAVPVCLRSWYLSLFEFSGPDEMAQFKQCDYECSTAELYRRFTMKVFPLPGTTRSGFIIVTSMRFAVPHVESERVPARPDIPAYADGEGNIHQCANCRRVRSATDSGAWHWVPEWVSHPPVNVTPSLCPKCTGNYYPDTSSGSRPPG